MNKCCVVPDTSVLLQPFVKNEYVMEAKSKELLDYCFDRNLLLLPDSALAGMRSAANNCSKGKTFLHCGQYYFQIMLKKIKTRYVPEFDLDKIMNPIIKLYTANGFTDVNLRLRSGLTIQNKYKNAIKDAYMYNLSDEDIQKLNDKMSVPDRGDLYILAFASTMKKDYERVLIASNDKHLMKWEGNKKVLEEVERIYGIETGSPNYVLEQLSAMEIPAKN
jgi:hypothetical protein